MEYIDCLFTSSLGCFIGVNVSFDELKSTRPYPAVPSQILFCWSFTIVQIKFDGILWGVFEATKCFRTRRLLSNWNNPSP